jgi:hypothetical protein
MSTVEPVYAPPPPSPPRGRYYARWPGLSQGDLGEGDLKVTTDYRNVLAEIVHDRLHRSTAKAFPGLSYQPIGVMKN